MPGIGIEDIEGDVEALFLNRPVNEGSFCLCVLIVHSSVYQCLVLYQIKNQIPLFSRTVATWTI